MIAKAEADIVHERKEFLSASVLDAIEQGLAIKALGEIASAASRRYPTMEWYLKEVGRPAYIAPQGKAIEVRFNRYPTRLAAQALVDDEWQAIDTFSTPVAVFDRWHQATQSPSGRGLAFIGDTLSMDDNDDMWVSNADLGLRVQVYAGSDLLIGEIDA